eukprot:EG_transcript_32620
MFAIGRAVGKGRRRTAGRQAVEDSQAPDEVLRGVGTGQPSARQSPSWHTNTTSRARSTGVVLRSGMKVNTASCTSSPVMDSTPWPVLHCRSSPRSDCSQLG